MRKNILVSIVTVCLNSEKTIEQTIQSVLKQTYSNIEYIIVDGGSTDGTVDIIKKYEEVFSDRLKWVSESDKGIYDAMNKGIRMSTGKIIGVLSSDDWYEENAVENVIEHYDPEYPYQVIYGMSRTVKDNYTAKITFVNHKFLESEMMCHEACFISRKAYGLTGLYSLRYKFGSDYDLMLRLTEHDEVKFVPVFEVFVNFRLGGITDKNGDEVPMENFMIRARYFHYSKRKYAFYMLWFKAKIAAKNIIRGRVK